MSPYSQKCADARKAGEREEKVKNAKNATCMRRKGIWRRIKLASLGEIWGGLGRKQYRQCLGGVEDSRRLSVQSYTTVESVLKKIKSGQSLVSCKDTSENRESKSQPTFGSYKRSGKKKRGTEEKLGHKKGKPSGKAKGERGDGKIQRKLWDRRPNRRRKHHGKSVRKKNFLGPGLRVRAGIAQTLTEIPQGKSSIKTEEDECSKERKKIWGSERLRKERKIGRLLIPMRGH